MSVYEKISKNYEKSMFRDFDSFPITNRIEEANRYFFLQRFVSCETPPIINEFSDIKITSYNPVEISESIDNFTTKSSLKASNNSRFVEKEFFTLLT